MFAYIMAPARRDGAGWGRQAAVAGARRSSSSDLAIANVLGTGVQLNGDGLDAADFSACTCCSYCCHAQPLQLQVFKFKVENLKI